MKNDTLIRKLVAKAATAFLDEEYIEALTEGGIVAKEAGLYIIGYGAVDYCYSVYSMVVDEWILNRGLPMSMRQRTLNKMGTIAPEIFRKIYNEYKPLLRNPKVKWNELLLMSIILAEPVRSEQITIETLCDLFENFEAMKPEMPPEEYH